MRGLNKVTLIGNLGKDPESNTLEGEISVAKFSLATTENYKDKAGQSHSETEWHQVVVWRSLADFVTKYLSKGSMIYLEGKLKTRSFTDKVGEKRFVTEVLADKIIMLDKPTDISEINAIK